ncbi:MAG: hypothetical protein F4Y07_03210 [Gemmatimonadetes bacterium]|nr:hypothetical protein [Gemmatimonadota bacterium]MYC90067.1 hypothetical protein [Gemmatimonadota bacterium]MYE15469.1 hypothetical protein [Gemmatimonadota bacterium]MYJ18819.1 hypothetical protein [Gemmatimonadota bacterium]
MGRDDKRQVAAEVALALLEAMRTTDLPADRLKDEDVRLTMPRRLGLSAVVDRQIALFRERVRQGLRMTADEFAEFIRLVMRRPDAAEVFFTMGSQLAGRKVRRVTRWLPRVLRLYLTRKRITTALRKLFGRRLGGFGSGSFTFEMSASPLVQVDPNGDACEMITGFCQRALQESVGGGLVVAKRQCETRGDRACRWTVDVSTRGKA